MTREKKLSVFTVAATYIGTVVGAGFASGQEVLQFFGYFGPKAFIGLFLSTVLFVFFGWQMLSLGLKLQADSHRPVVEYAAGKTLGKLIDYVIIFFLFGALTLMAAGSGAVFQEQFGLSPLLGSVVMIGITLLTVILGIDSVIKSISFIVPFLITSVMTVGISVIVQSGLAGAFAAQPMVARAAVGNWLLAALLYVSYNLILAVAVLAPLGKEANSERTVKQGAVWGGLGLGLGAMVIVTALLITLPQASRFEVPMIFLAGVISPVVRMLYSGVLFAEVYTTAVGSLYGFVARFFPTTSNKGRWLAAGAGAGAFVMSRFGFVNLISYLLPAVGFAGFILLAGLTYTFFRDKATGAIPAPAAKTYEIKRENEQRDS